MSTIYTPRPNLSNFNQNNDLSQGIESLASIFANNQVNADTQTKRMLQQAQINDYTSKIADAQAKQQQRDVGASEAKNLADIFSPSMPQPIAGDPNGGTTPGLSITDKLNDPNVLGKINTSVLNLGLKGGLSGADIANLLRTVTANSAVPDNILARSVVGAGEKLGENDALSIAGQDRIRAGNTANSIAIEQAKKVPTTLPNMPDYSSELTPPDPSDTIYNNINKSTGPLSSVVQKGANIAGFFGKDVAPDVTAARKDAELFSSRLVAALRVSPRFPEGERKQLEKDISVRPDAWTSPTVAKQNLLSLDKSLSDAERKAIADVSDPLLKTSDRQAAESNLRAIRQARTKLGVPGSPGHPAVATASGNSHADQINAIDAELDAINKQLGQ